MISNIWNTIIYQPLYNGLIFLADILPWADIGIVIILFTIFIKLALLPLTLKGTRTQHALRAIAPELEKIKKEFKDDKQQQYLATMDLYKEKGIKPFSGFLLLFIQLPILFGLYFIFLKSGLPEISTELLYSFVPAPQNVNIVFLGFIDLTQKSLVLGLLTGITQFFHTKLSLGKKDPKAFEGDKSFKGDFMRTMNLQMRFVLPVLFGFIAYSLSAAIALYWTTSNIFHIVQELYVKRKSALLEFTDEKKV